MKIDTSTWKHFKIGDYFDIHPTKAYTGLSNKDLNDGGETPFVVNSAANNGIGGFSTKPATEKGNMCRVCMKKIMHGRVISCFFLYRFSNLRVLVGTLMAER